jgi:hypothetical protein
VFIDGFLVEVWKRGWLVGDGRLLRQRAAGQAMTIDPVFFTRDVARLRRSKWIPAFAWMTTSVFEPVRGDVACAAPGKGPGAAPRIRTSA